MFNRSETPLLTLPGPRGLPIEIAPSFLFLAFIFVGLNVSQHALIFFGLIALAILLHELGHAWGAWVQGNGVRRVVLWGGGGFCEYTRASPPRERELEVAMGPLANLALWALSSLAGGWLIDGYYATGHDMLWYVGWYVDLFAAINLTLFALNLIPVQPLDGGKLLELALLRLTSTGRAMRITGTVGLVFAVLWLPAMLVSFLTWGWLLLFIPSIPLHWRMARGEVVAY
ncbi:MAG: site-2 protease family protein [Jannaschia sp.]